MYDLNALLRLIGRKGVDYVKNLLTNQNLPDKVKQELSSEYVLVNGEVNNSLIDGLEFLGTINSSININAIKTLLKNYDITTIIELFNVSALSEQQKEALSSLHVIEHGYVNISLLMMLQSQIDQIAPNADDSLSAYIVKPSIA